MGIKSQRKGRNAERELAALLQQHGYDVRPGEPLNYGKEPDIVGLKNIHVEVKRREAVNLSAALEQAQRDSERFGGLPCVFHRANRKPWTVSMPLDAWLQLYAKTACQCGGHCQSGKEWEPSERPPVAGCGLPPTFYNDGKKRKFT